MTSLQSGAVSESPALIFAEEAGERGSQLPARFAPIAQTILLRPVQETVVPEWTKPHDFDAAQCLKFRCWQHHGQEAVRERLLAGEVAEQIYSAPGQTYVALDLNQVADDHRIWCTLPRESHTPFRDIERFIQAQPGGMPGFLVADGNANIFNLAVKGRKKISLAVHWHQQHSRWCVIPYEHYQGMDPEWLWECGCRVVCPGKIYPDKEKPAP